MESLDALESELVEIEEDIRETVQEIERQKSVVRRIDNPFERRYAEHVLATYQEHQKAALADQPVETSGRVQRLLATRALPERARQRQRPARFVEPTYRHRIMVFFARNKHDPGASV